MSRGALLFCATFAVALAATRLASADDTRGSEAGQDFATGTRAFAAGDYRAAGTAFEDAYRKKPHHASLWNAGRSWQRAGELARAANLYLRYLGEAPTDARDRDHATDALRDLSARLARLDVKSAEGRDLRVDGQELIGGSIYVVPGEHVVSGRFGERTARRTVTVAAGLMSIALEPPPPESTTATTTTPPRKEEPPTTPRKTIPWTVVGIGAGLTAVAGGLTIWSGLDTLEKRDRFLEQPTHEKLADGHDRQDRTNVLLATTIGLGVVTAAVALYFVLSDGRGSATGSRARSVFVGNLP